MTSGRSIGSALVLLACCLATMASTASADDPRPAGRADPRRDPGRSDEFRNYVPEIMRGEGLNDFATARIIGRWRGHAAAYDVVVLSRTRR